MSGYWLSAIMLCGELKLSSSCGYIESGVSEREYSICESMHLAVRNRTLPYGRPQNLDNLVANSITSKEFRQCLTQHNHPYPKCLINNCISTLATHPNGKRERETAESQ